MVTDHANKVKGRDLVFAVFMKVRSHVKAIQWKFHKRADLWAEHKLVSEPLQVYADNLPKKFRYKYQAYRDIDKYQKVDRSYQVQKVKDIK